MDKSNYEIISEQEKIIFVHMTTGQQIKALRKRLNITQQELADLLWVEKLTISRWESDERKCKGTALRLINILTEFHLWEKI